MFLSLDSARCNELAIIGSSKAHIFGSAVPSPTHLDAPRLANATTLILSNITLEKKKRTQSDRDGEVKEATA